MVGFKPTIVQSLCKVLGQW